MLHQYLKIAFRNIRNDRGYSLINILGLSVALACCLVLIFWIKFELSYENCFPDAGRIYRVLEVERRDGGLHKSDYIRPGIAEQLKENFPEIEAATCVHHEQLPYTYEENDGIMVNKVEVSPDFFKMFQYEYVEGSPEALGQAETDAIMSEETARKFFGNESAIGKSISFGGHFEVTIVGVVKMPQNTFVRFDLLTVVRNPMRLYGFHYVLIGKNAAFSDETQQRLANFLSTMRDTDNKLAFQPIKEIHLHSSEELARDIPWYNYGNKAQLYLFSLAALLLLLIAVINYVNTSIARSMTRAKEVGVRKIAGSTQAQLIARFLIEAFVVSFLAVIVAFFLARLFFPHFSQLMGTVVALTFNMGSVLVCVGVCVMMTLLSGAYSAFYLSFFNPVIAFKGGSATGTKNGLRKTLVGLQFFLSITIFICTLLIYKQISYMFHADTGVEKDNIVVINTDLWYDSERFFHTIKTENPDVIEATIASAPPYNAKYNYSGVSWDGAPEEAQLIEFNQIFCDHHYADLFGLEVLEGRFIPSDLTWWDETEDNSYGVVINETFKKLMNVDNPIGITVKYAWGMEGKIVGVIKDFNFKPLRQPITPLIISFNPEAMNSVFVKMSGKNRQATLQYVLEKYREVYQKDRETNRPVIYSMVDDDYKKMYQTELRTSKVLLIFSIASLLISLMGIFGMISLMLEKRTKEIALRKIHGAKIADIIRLFVKEFTTLLGVAVVTSVPVAYWIMSRWILDYAYRTPLSWWLFVSVVLLIFTLTVVLISSQVYNVARRDPVKSLKNE
ncbi:MAG: ABC transporter permease [Bacteroidales bacterium]|nr:ABC transporter permease [Bacteroidales bacterium]